MSGNHSSSDQSVGNSPEELYERVHTIIDSIAKDLIEASHHIHAHPELNYEEYIASETLARVGATHGLEVERGVFGVDTALAAAVGEGPTVCVMSEYDALPGIGHGCGHNVIGTAGLGAAIALARIAGTAGGRLLYLGTPAEEGGGGKIEMARHGALDGVDVAMMVHPADADLTTIDAIALQQLEVRYEGRAAHAAAAPEQGRNALDAAVLGYTAVAALRQHIAPTERVHGIFTKSGDKPNIVPHEAEMLWYVRSDTTRTLQSLKTRVVHALESGAHATGCTCSSQWVGNVYADMVDNTPLGARYVQHSSRLGRNVHIPSASSARVVGSTDMGNVSHLVPSIHPMIKIAKSGTAIHTADFAASAITDMADQAILDGAKAMACAAIDFWLDAGLRREIRADFDHKNPDRDVL
jgi:amidohydrolase